MPAPAGAMIPVLTPILQHLKGELPPVHMKIIPRLYCAGNHSSEVVFCIGESAAALNMITNFVFRRMDFPIFMGWPPLPLS
jgi:hypothetical protein